jgi:hypothetical protein
MLGGANERSVNQLQEGTLAIAPASYGRAMTEPTLTP